MLCPNCYIGRLQLAKATYVQQWGREILVMPHAPAYQCNMCGYTIFDDDFVSHLQLLMDAEHKGGRIPADRSRRRTGVPKTTWERNRRRP